MQTFARVAEPRRLPLRPLLNLVPYGFGPELEGQGLMDNPLRRAVKLALVPADIHGSTNVIPQLAQPSPAAHRRSGLRSDPQQPYSPTPQNTSPSILVPNCPGRTKLVRSPIGPGQKGMYQRGPPPERLLSIRTGGAQFQTTTTAAVDVSAVRR
jgi:hypothetical protein